MLVVFVHGWGVRQPDYGSLPDEIRLALGADTIDIWLSEYASYSDKVSMDDLATAFERARLACFPTRQFSCITHSTGGPVIRTWLDRYDGPMTALVMLAPPNQGSALAQLGKGRLSRLKCWMENVEPGQRLLDWLELGSEECWDLNIRWLDSKWSGRILVVAGAQPDRSLYDHLNSYTGERGSDGVVRVAAANFNYSLLRLRQSGDTLHLTSNRRSRTVPLLILGSSHSAIRELREADGTSPAESMLIVKVVDSSGQPVNDFDMLFTAGPHYSPNELPSGFFIDRQRNSLVGNTLTYYLNHAAFAQSREFGFQIVPRPDSGPVHFASAEFRSTLFLRRNETTMIEIVLNRILESRLFSLTPRDCE